MNDTIRARLDDAAVSGALVRLRRAIPGAGRLDGFIVSARAPNGP